MDIPVPAGHGPLVYKCPMHPEVVSDELGHCPECGMKLLPSEAQSSTYACPMHPEVVSEQPGHCPECGMKLLPAELVGDAAEGHAHEGGAHGHEHSTADGIEWEDDMVDVNRLTTPANMRWKLIDRQTGAENAAIEWRLRVGDQVKIRLLNEMAGTTRCTIRSTSTGLAASSSSLATATSSRTSSGPTRCPAAGQRRHLLDVTTPVAGWLTAT